MPNVGNGSGNYHHEKITICKDCGAPRDLENPHALCIECRKRRLKANHRRYLDRQKSKLGSEQYLLKRQVSVLKWRGVKNISPEVIKQRLEDQGGKCAICSKTTPGGRGNWHIDHDHVTGEIRGLLCTKCNLMLGYADDDPEKLLLGVNYLRKP